MPDKKHLLTAISTVAAASFSLSAMASSDSTGNPFQAEDLPAGFQVSADEHKEGKCGEGKCGEDKEKDKHEEGKCGEGKCGEGKCGEDRDKEKDKDKDEEGKCGEGSCGAL